MLGKKARLIRWLRSEYERLDETHRHLADNVLVDAKEEIGMLIAYVIDLEARIRELEG